MIHYLEEHIRLRREKTREAIALAMESRWEEAVSVNRQLLEASLDDVEASNRLGKALMELGEWDGARKAFEHSLTYAPDNTIAQKNLTRVSNMKGRFGAKTQSPRLAPGFFIGESGKTTRVALEEIPDASQLAVVLAGVPAEIHRNGGTVIELRTSFGQYLGRLPRALGSRLESLLEGGNEYQAAVAGTGADQVTVVLRETFQHPSLRGVVSFLPKESSSPTVVANSSPIADGTVATRMPLSWGEEEEEDEPALRLYGSPASEVISPGTDDTDEEPVKDEVPDLNDAYASGEEE